MTALKHRLKQAELFQHRSAIHTDYFIYSSVNTFMPRNERNHESTQRRRATENCFTLNVNWISVWEKRIQVFSALRWGAALEQKAAHPASSARVINCLYFHLKWFVKSVITFSMIEGFIYALVKDWHRSGFTVGLMSHSRSGSKSWLPFQKRFKFCTVATLPGRGSNWSPRSWCESCSPQGWAQDPDSQTEDTLLPVWKQIRYSHFNRLNFK